ncbi:MAG: glycosyltransferase [Mariniphaga sp.]
MIPKIIHYCWLSGEPYPELIKKCLDSWKVHLPDYKFELWDLAKVQNIDSEWLRQTIAVKKYAFAADFIRVYALSHFGGVYLDADVELAGSLDPFIRNDFFIGYEYNNDLEPAVFGSVAGHQWLSDLLGYYQDRPFIKIDGEQDIRTLPSIFNETAAIRFGFKSNGKMQEIKNPSVKIYPCDFFSPKNIYFKKIKRTGNTVAIHHFHGSWYKKTNMMILKQIFHQFLYLIGGKSFHNQFIQIIRRISK